MGADLKGIGHFHLGQLLLLRVVVPARRLALATSASCRARGPRPFMLVSGPVDQVVQPRGQSAVAPTAAVAHERVAQIDPGEGDEEGDEDDGRHDQLVEGHLVDGGRIAAAPRRGDFRRRDG